LKVAVAVFAIGGLRSECGDCDHSRAVLRFANIASETVWKQLVRAADSVSNNLGEADDASSTADFVHKIRLTLRETKESRQCLAKLRMASLDGHDRVADLEREAGELCAVFATIAMKVAKRLELEKPGKRQKQV
jgi:four helix bundle protein